MLGYFYSIRPCCCSSRPQGHTQASGLISLNNNVCIYSLHILWFVFFKMRWNASGISHRSPLWFLEALADLATLCSEYLEQVYIIVLCWRPPTARVIIHGKVCCDIPALRNCSGALSQLFVVCALCIARRVLGCRGIGESLPFSQQDRAPIGIKAPKIDLRSPDLEMSLKFKVVPSYQLLGLGTVEVSGSTLTWVVSRGLNSLSSWKDHDGETIACRIVEVDLGRRGTSVVFERQLVNCCGSRSVPFGFDSLLGAFGSHTSLDCSHRLFV